MGGPQHGIFRLRTDQKSCYETKIRVGKEQPRNYLAGVQCAACPVKPPITLRRPHSSYQRVVQGKCPLHFLNSNGAVCSNTLFSSTSALTSSLLFRGNSTCKILEHRVWSNTSGFQFWGPLARTNFLSALCGLPKPQGRAWTAEVECQTPARSTNPNSCSTGLALWDQKKCRTTEKKALAYRGKGRQKYRYCFSCLKVRGGSLPSKKRHKISGKN